MKLLIFLTLLATIEALATEDEGVPLSPFSDLSILGDSYETHLKTQAVLKHFQVPKDLDPQVVLQPYQNQTTEKEIQQGLAAIDPMGQFSRLFSIDSQGVLRAFKDRDAKQEIDFSVSLSNQRIPSDPIPQRTDLKGVRIALDPGHMGDPYWDNETGKYVQDVNGNRLSEGTLATQVVLILEERFKNLGAEVFLTRRELGAVSKVPRAKLDLEYYGRLKLEESAYLPWFQDLLKRFPIGQSLFDAFSQDSNTKKLFSNSQRSQYFILRQDLYERARLIEQFKPDIILVVHFDTSDPPGNPNGINTRGYTRTKSYVPGGFSDVELSSPMHRINFLKHLLDRKNWEKSLLLSRSITQSLSKTLGIGLDPVGGEVMTVPLEPGVFARNLVLTRRLGGHAISYLECLYYNDPKEFAALRKNDYTIDIGGVPTGYSERLKQVADGIAIGTLKYFGL
jgi:N-acetylmuramoyl-L-alanine amidase